MSPHEYTQNPPGGGAPAVAPPPGFDDCLRRAGWPPAPHPSPGARVLADGGTASGGGVLVHRRGARCAVLSGTHASLKVCGVWRFAPSGTLCVFPCAADGPVDIALPRSKCHTLIGPEHALGGVLLQSGASNVSFRRRPHPGGDVEIFPRAGGAWLCTGCGHAFGSAAEYSNHVGGHATAGELNGAGAAAFHNVLPLEYARPGKPFGCHDHGTVSSNHGFNCELHARLRQLYCYAARRADSPRPQSPAL